MNDKLLSCLIAGALCTALALSPPAFARGGGGGHGGGFGGGHGGGFGGGMHGGGFGGGMRGRREAECISARWAVARASAAPVSLACLSRMRRSHHGFPERRSIMASATGPSITGSSITASTALRLWACPSATQPTPPTTAAGAERGRRMDCNGSTSAATTTAISRCHHRVGAVRPQIVMVVTRHDPARRNRTCRR